MKISLADKALIKEIRKDFADKTGEYRLAVFKAIAKDYCYFCADKHTPCYCMDD